MTDIIVKDDGRVFKIETGYGFDPNNSTVTWYHTVDQFGRLLDGECMFCGTWEACQQYVKEE